MTATATRCRRDENGQGLIELVVFAVPVLLFFLILIVYSFRLPDAGSRVSDAAEGAARAASTAHDGASADRAAHAAAQATLADRGASCAQMQVVTDLSQYRPGGLVTVTVTCQVDQSDLGLIHVGGTRAVSASFSSPVDLAATARP